MKLIKPVNYLLLFFLTFFMVSQKVSAQALKKKIDKIILSEIKDKDGPGGVFMVAKNGKPICKKAFGKANIELEVDLTTDHIFQLGSMTILFTAIAIFVLDTITKI